MVESGLPLNVLITGSEGAIGSLLSRRLGTGRRRLRLFDKKPVTGNPNAEYVHGQVEHFDEILAAMSNIECVIHLAAIPHEAEFQELLQSNIQGTYNVFEAARRKGVRRVVLASSNHVVGFHASNKILGTEVSFRPDTLYGVTKVLGESLGRLYHDKWGLEVICLRIGSFRSVPQTERELATWLSYEDAVRLFDSSIEAVGVGFVVLFGVSANRRSMWDNGDAAGVIGYEPHDDAETYAEAVSSSVSADVFHGGSYTLPEHTGGF